jgi:predicted RNase H-like nuclease (RuvC/YqgF family)
MPKSNMKEELRAVAADYGHTTDQAAGAGTRTVDVDYTLAALRSENARLKSQAELNERTHASNEQTHKRNSEHNRKEIVRLQTELLASQDKVQALQNMLLSLREIVNRPLPKE